MNQSPLFQAYSASGCYDSDSPCFRLILLHCYDLNSLCFRTILLQVVWLTLPLFQAYSASGCYDSNYPCFRTILLQTAITQTTPISEPFCFRLLWLGLSMFQTYYALGRTGLWKVKKLSNFRQYRSYFWGVWAWYLRKTGEVKDCKNQ